MCEIRYERLTEARTEDFIRLRIRQLREEALG